MRRGRTRKRVVLHGRGRSRDQDLGPRVRKTQTLVDRSRVHRSRVGGFAASALPVFVRRRSTGQVLGSRIQQGNIFLKAGLLTINFKIFSNMYKV